MDAALAAQILAVEPRHGQCPEHRADQTGRRGLRDRSLVLGQQDGDLRHPSFRRPSDREGRETTEPSTPAMIMWTSLTFIERRETCPAQGRRAPAQGTNGPV
ncbi:hypothetical protein BKM31_18495 [[Actinomadura] parvosata subsp. kistnae]|uniref:Uncharacterized protein n=1 Tax=[Actinomadura] parvosata subsp. kistnae TaxID=1909395 RepID=A0A1U9ZZ02_9ACTN|nr:hypothetical protein BKM31_18495 [Nonomuraea sp. ATCC 55076]